MKIKLRFTLCLLSLSFAAGNIYAQDVDPFGGDATPLPVDPNAKDPFAAADPAPKPLKPVPAKKAAPAEKPQIEQMVSVFIEYIEIDHLKANHLIRENAGKRDLTGLRNLLDEMIETGDAELLESAYVVGRSGQRTKIESIEEKIYATEYDPPELPQNIGQVANLPKDPSVFKTAANPTAFEMRPVGVTLEVDPQLNNGVIGLHLAPELIEYLGDYKFVDDDSPHDESKTIKMPKFYALKVNSAAISMLGGETILLATHTPHADETKRILVLLRADIVK